MATIHIDTIEANQLAFTYRSIGAPTKGEAVILLHGFPETSKMWEKTMRHLHEQENYYCIAPDLRGYSAGARPRGKKNYDIELLMADVIAIADSLGIKKFHLIGHDWGAAIGWVVVSQYPDRIQSWTAMSVPHVAAFGYAINNDEKQHKMSAYARQFQFPWIPELIIRKNNFQNFREKCWYLSEEEEVDAYLDVFRQKRALSTALNYYRQNWKKIERIANKLSVGDIHTPTITIWGNKDVAISRTAVERESQYMKGDYKLIELDASHWLIQEKPQRIWSEMLQHLKKYPITVK